MAEAYAAKKYAFVSDVMRLLVLEQYGGVYIDTDVEVVRDIAPLMDDEGFIGFENDQFVNSGPVSYTHLDVYKRQVNGRRQKGIFPSASRQKGVSP